MGSGSLKPIRAALFFWLCATAAAQSPSFRGVESVNTYKNAAYCNDTSGAANTITCSTAVGFVGYVKGQAVDVLVANSATGATTININTLGPKAVTYNGATAMTTSILYAGGTYRFEYDGTEFVLQGSISGGTVTSVASACGISGGTITTTGTLSRVPTVNVVGSPYGITTSNCGKTIIGNATLTIAQAGSAGFATSWFTDLFCPVSICTLTPTTSTINGAATLVLTQYQSARIISDGTNYEALFYSTAVSPTTNQNIRTVGASFGSFQSGATALSSSQTACVSAFVAGTIKAVHIIADVSGSATIDVQTVVHSSWTGTASVSSITAADIPALASAAAYTDTTLTGWTTSLAANTDVCFDD